MLKSKDSDKENTVEKYLKNKVEKLGGKAFKFVSPGCAGVPDRIVCLPQSKIVFVETKRPKGGRVDPLQKYWHEWLNMNGFNARIINTKELVDAFIKEFV